MAKLSSLEKLKIMAVNAAKSRMWCYQISASCLGFIEQAADLYLDGSDLFSSKKSLFTLIKTVIAEDYPDDLQHVPQQRTFETWVLSRKESKPARTKQKPSQPASTKKQAVSKRKTV